MAEPESVRPADDDQPSGDGWYDKETVGHFVGDLLMFVGDLLTAIGQVLSGGAGMH